MGQWKITGIAYATKVLGVIEAETEKDAIEIAQADDMIYDEMYVSLCHHCADEVEIGDFYKFTAEING